MLAQALRKEWESVMREKVDHLIAQLQTLWKSCKIPGSCIEEIVDSHQSNLVLYRYLFTYDYLLAFDTNFIDGDATRCLKANI